MLADTLTSIAATSGAIAGTIVVTTGNVVGAAITIVGTFFRSFFTTLTGITNSTS